VRVYGAGARRSTAIFGGVGFPGQLAAIRRRPEIVVATPGRLLDHARQRTIDLSQVEVLVLDEADRMLDMGFIRDIRAILALLPDQRQNLLFSATFSTDIRRLADEFLDRPASVQATPRNAPTDLVRQVVHPVDRMRKRELLTHLVRTHTIEQALVFTRTKHGANKLADQLRRDGIATAAIHGNKSQPQRVRALNDFKANRVTLLVATEVAARGLDIEQLPHVVNFELPIVPSDYVHRIGRTGRAGLQGDAISLVSVDEAPLLRDIERLLGAPIRSELVPGFEPDPTIRAEPIRQRTTAAVGGHGTGRRARRAWSGTPASAGRGHGPRGQRPDRRGAPSAGRGTWHRLPGERSAR
jgi:ATP-dependent RNA helicase RhlE